MKKSRLALIIAALLTVTGCEEKETLQKLQAAEQTISQLQNELNTAREKAEQKFPALQVEIVEFFNKEQEIQFEKEPNQDWESSSSVSEFVSLPKTGIAWLDQLLMTHAFEHFLSEGERVPEILTAQIFTEKLEQHYAEMVSEAKEYKPIGMSFNLFSYYLGQRNQIASFSMMADSYSGGAHGIYASRYLNIDTNKKSVIQLNDLIAPNQQASIKEMLWKNYQNSRLNEQGQYDGWIAEKDFRISENFYFSEEGIYFVYPPYELGSYAEGEVKVLLGWYEANELLNPDYQRSKKDGFFEDVIE